MQKKNYEISRTLRCKNVNAPGVLGRLTTAVGEAGANIGNVSTVYLGHRYTIRDIDVMVTDRQHMQKVINAVLKLKDVSIVEVRDEVLAAHKNGKIRMMNNMPVKSQSDLRKMYTPGVAEVCQLIKDHSDWKDTYTMIPYSVAIVTDGTAVLGLGNIGTYAGMPVMEGKAALMQQLAGVSGIPILVNTTDSREIVETVVRIAHTFGAIQLEDIASPRCFEILAALEQTLAIPVMHDDQQGTAVVTVAALVNACRLTKMELAEAKIGLIGLGAAGLGLARFLMPFTGNRVLGTARTEASRNRLAELGGTPSSIEEIMRTCDIVVSSTGVKGLIEPSMVKNGQVIFALSNPYPEIAPEAALAAGAALAVDGRTLNNLLGYPGIWRGTLDSRAAKINHEMYKAAALAIAGSAGEGDIVPSPLDPKVHLVVAHSVARAAMESGVARRRLDDDYFDCTDIKEPPWA